MLKVLIADDHPLFLRGLKDILRPEGYDIDEAPDGLLAVRKVRECMPDICILDVNMPHLDGLEVVRQMRRQHLPGEVIFLTMHKEPDLLDAAMDLGVKGFVLKDDAVAEIVECIRRVADGHNYISPALSDQLVNRRSHVRALNEENAGLARLTPAERRVLKLIAEDRTSKEIAEELGLSPRTIENHRTNICTKLNVHGIHSLVKFAYHHRSSL
jgi:DNA-binding NarL/FixJ family response regulator